jgi:hypothetical protein
MYNYIMLIMCGVQEVPPTRINADSRCHARHSSLLEFRFIDSPMLYRESGLHIAATEFLV